MKTIFKHKPATIAVAAGMSCLITGQTVLAESVRSANRNRSTSYNRNTNVSVNRNANVNVNRNANVNVNRNANVNVNRDIDVHHDVHIDVDNDEHDHFWGGVAVGVAATVVTGAVVASLTPKAQPVVVQNTTYY